jgi:hypothetical protein
MIDDSARARPLQDFPATREVLAGLDEIIDGLRAGLEPPVPVPFLDNFRWEFPERTTQVVQLAKAVRIAAALNAAMHLADLGFTTECGTLLRIVSDFSSEIIYLGEGVFEGRLPSEDQQTFIAHHFSSLPSTPDELAEMERSQYVARRKILQTMDRIAVDAGIKVQDHQRMTAYLNKGYDAYVHGSHQSAMELYDGRRFMLTGNHFTHAKCQTKVAIATKLNEALIAFRFISAPRGLFEIDAKIRQASKKVEASQEDTSLPCAGL